MVKKKLDSRTRGVRNNNPFNIKLTSDHWKGQLSRLESTDSHFVQFRSIYFGLRAGILLLKNYLDMGYNTISEILNRFAPPNENFTNHYIQFVSSYLAADYDYVDELPFLDVVVADREIDFGTVQFYHLCYAICMFESEYKFNVSDYNLIMANEFNPKYQL